MNQIKREPQSLARWLIAFEAAELSDEEKPQAVARVFDRLRLLLIPIIGPVGFRSLLSRVISVSAVKVPLLTTAQVSEEGILLLDDPQPVAVEALLTEFFDMLFGFIGTHLTLCLVRSVWAEAPFEQLETNTEGRS